LTGAGSSCNSRVIQHDRVLDDGQLLWSLLRRGEPRVERPQGCLVGGRGLAAALVVIGLSVEQQPVEPRGRVVLRLPATGAAAAIDGTAVAATAVAPAASERHDGPADDATQRSTSEPGVVVGIVIKLIVRRPAPRTGAQRVPVQPPVHHRVDGRVGVAQQHSGHGDQPVDRAPVAAGVVSVTVFVDIAVLWRR